MIKFIFRIYSIPIFYIHISSFKKRKTNIVIFTIVSIVRIVKKAKIRAEEKTREVDDVIIKHGVRYTPEATIVDEKGNDNVTYVKGDIIIQPRKVVKVGKHEDVKPGKWTILASNDSRCCKSRKTFKGLCVSRLKIRPPHSREELVV